MARKRRRQAGKGGSSREAPVSLGSLTHVGMKRSGNEDAHCTLIGANAPPGTDALLAVADGMGGRQSGEVASAMAVRGLQSRLSGGNQGDATAPSDGRYEMVLEHVVKEINAELRQAADRPENRGMGTTLTTALLVGPTLFIAHVGDSRAYMLRGGNLQQLTQDHSWVAEEVARGALTPEQAREHPRKNVITRAMGIEPSVQVDTGVVQMEQGDIFLLSSDGLHGLVTDAEISQTLAQEDPQAACKSLIKQANDLGGNDNITVVVARVNHLDGQGALSDSRAALPEQTTLQLQGSPSSGGKIFKLLRILSSPVWVPFWLVAKLVRLPFRRRHR